jgi:hypothetical protein
MRWYDGEREIVFVTTQVVSLKVFRLKAKVIRRATAYVVEETAASRSNHGSTIRSIPVFPNSLQPKIYPPDQALIFNTSMGMKKQLEYLRRYTEWMWVL